MRISDWSSDVCSSDLPARISENSNPCSSSPRASIVIDWTVPSRSPSSWCVSQRASYRLPTLSAIPPLCMHHPQPTPDLIDRSRADHIRSEEHTSELQSLMRISYAVFCLKKKNTKNMSLTQQSINTQNILICMFIIL